MSRIIGVFFLVLVCTSFKIQKVFSAFSLKTESKVEAVNWPFVIVSKGTWTLTSLTLSAVPARNMNNSIVMKGRADDDTQFAKVDINVKLNGLYLHSETVNFSVSAGEGDIFEFNYSNFIPSFAPAGTYVIQFTHKDKAGKENGIWSLTFKL